MATTTGQKRCGTSVILWIRDNYYWIGICVFVSLIRSSQRISTGQR